MTCGRFFTGGTGKLRLPPSLALSWLPTWSLSFCSVLKNLINLPKGQHYHDHLLEKYFTPCDQRLPEPVTFCALGRSQATDCMGIFSSVAVNVGVLGSLVIAGFWTTILLKTVLKEISLWLISSTENENGSVFRCLNWKFFM